MTAPIDGARAQDQLSRLADLKRQRDDADPGGERVAIVAKLDAIRAELHRRAEAWTYRIVSAEIDCRFDKECDRERRRDTCILAGRPR